MRSPSRGFTAVLAVLLALGLLTPGALLVGLHHAGAATTVDEPTALPSPRWACVMGARVYGPGDPSPSPSSGSRPPRPSRRRTQACASS